MGQNSQELQSLAARITANAKVIGNFYDESGRSSEAYQSATLLPADAPQEAVFAQQDMKEAARKILQLSTDTTDYLTEHSIHYQHLSCLRWLCYFRVIFEIPMTGSIAYSDVAKACNVPESTLKAVARMAMTSGFLAEKTPGKLSHTSKSAPFVTNPNLYDWALYMSSTSSPVAARFAEATEKWGATEEKNETAYNIQMNTDLPFFDHLAQDAAMTKQFAGYMKNVTTNEATSTKHLLAGFDWASVGGSKIVDLGGSSGHASIALAKEYPTLSFVVQDLPDTLEGSKIDLSSLPADVASRISFQGHDFFIPQPIKDADIFLLRMIIHDWPFTQAVTILRHLFESMKPGARLVIMDTVLPQPGSIPATQEAILRVRDLTMRQTFNSFERELEDWNNLLAAVDPSLKINNVVQPWRSAMAVIEIGSDGTSFSSGKQSEYGNSSLTNGIREQPAGITA